jgi:hypothetical protein
VQTGNWRERKMDSKRKTVLFLKLKRENLSTGGLGFKELMERVEYHTSNATQVAYRTLVDEIKQGYTGDANDVGAYREYLLSTIMKGERRPIIEHASDDDFMMNFIDLIMKEELMTPQVSSFRLYSLFVCFKTLGIFWVNTGYILKRFV